MITIDPEFQALIPPLSNEEVQQLEVSLLAEGCRDSLVVWEEENILLDGHHRKAICDANDIEYHTAYLSFLDRSAALVWMIRNQLGRRNLTPYQRAELALKLKPVIEERARERMLAGTQLDPTLNSAQGESRDELAKIAGVGHDTMRRVEVLADEASEAVKEQLRKGETSINHEYLSLRELKPHVSLNSGNNEWYTPPQFTDAARAVMGKIDLDPASSHTANVYVKASEYFTIERDGLTKRWHGCVWLNPPYAQPLVQQFVEKLLEEIPEIEQAIVLVNNATETVWFQEALKGATSVCFLQGRIKFLDESGTPANTPLQGQAILYFGEQFQRFADVFSEFGQVMVHAG